MPTTKKVISAFCATILFLMCTISTACASNTGINPYMDHIALGQCSLDIDGTTAKVNAWVEGRTDVTRTEVTVELQEQYSLPLKLRQCPEDLQHQPPCRAAGVNALLLADKLNAFLLQCLCQVQQVTEVSGKA